MNLLRLLSGILPLLLGVWLVLQLLPVLSKWSVWFCAAALAACFAAAALLGSTFYVLLNLAAAVVFSCCAAWFVAD